MSKKSISGCKQMLILQVFGWELHSYTKNIAIYDEQLL